MNATLRAQLETATTNGDRLLADVNKLTDNWDKLNDELLEKEKNVRNQEISSIMVTSHLLNDLNN